MGAPVWTGSCFHLWVSGVGDAEAGMVPLNLRLSFCTTGLTGFISQGSGCHVLTSVECVLFILLPCYPPKAWHLRQVTCNLLTAPSLPHSLLSGWSHLLKTEMNKVISSLNPFSGFPSHQTSNAVKAASRQKSGDWVTPWVAELRGQRR